MVVFLTEKGQKEYVCEKCDFKCSKKYSWNRHIMTAKHIKGINGDVSETKIESKGKNKSFTCENCNKSYISRNGIWLHKKKCVKSEVIDDKMLIKMVLDVVKSNNETQKQLLEICKNGTMNNSHNNSHNKTFNMQFFLNETCKDAMNIMDFVKDIKINLNDLEDVGKLGYVDGISNIIIKNLKDIDISKRPVHCSDLKREVLYIKDEDHWSKEKEKMNYAIKHIAHKNIQMLPEWKHKNPSYTLNDGHKNDQFMQIVNESMGGSGKKEEQVYQEKIISKVAKHVVVEK